MPKEVLNFTDLEGFLWVNTMFRRWPTRAMIIHASRNDGDYAPHNFTATFRAYPEIADFYLGDGKFDRGLAQQWLEVHLQQDWDKFKKVTGSSSGGSMPMSQHE